MHSPNKNYSEEYDDDLDSPTEPMMRIVLAPHSSPLTERDISTMPTRPLQAAVPVTTMPETPVAFPVFPASPVKHLNGSPPSGIYGNAAPVLSGNGAGVAPRRSLTPDIVGVCFVVIQMLLLARVLLLLFNVSSASPLAEACYAASGVFALPFRTLFDHIQPITHLGSGVIAYLAPLVSILIYGLISRILVRFLKALLNSR